MVVQHNLTAMNSNRMLGITTKSQSKSTEKLSSGYKINRAADDAAGLAISEKMRKQIRGLTQASANAQDGISAVQTAEGALTEVHDMIQRMSELAVKAANGTNSQEERDYIQLEVDELIKEIDRVAETTKFNDIYLLKGDPDAAAYKYVETEATEDTEVLRGAGGATIYNADGTVATDGDLGVYTDAASACDSGLFFTGVTGSGVSVAMDNNLALGTTLSDYIETTDGTNITFKQGAGKLYYSNGTEVDEADLATLFKVSSGSVSGNAQVTLYTAITGDGAITDTDLALTTIPGQPASTAQLYNADGSEISADDLASLFDEEGKFIGTGIYADDGAGSTVAVDATNYATYIVEPGAGEASTLTLNLHVGAESAKTNKITLEIQSMDAASIKVAGLKVDSEDAATNAIDGLKEALKIVSEQRAKMGAVQNRLEHTINNLDNVIENTTSAESQIRDTDMATEMVKYSNNNILAQAGQAMLAQSNQANQGVLSLLG